MNTEETHIIGLKVENFHRITVANLEIPAGPGLVKITGKNKHGKSSLLYAIADALGGEGQVKPAVINEDADNGTGIVTVTLSNGFTIQRKFTEKAPKGYLTITHPDGKKTISQGLISESLGPRSFDPLALFQLKKPALRKVFFSLATQEDLESQLDQIQTRRDVVTLERRPLEATKLKANMTKAPEGERPDQVDVSGEMDRLKVLREAEEARRVAGREAHAARFERDTIEGKIKAAEENLSVLERQHGQALEIAETTGKAFDVLADPTEDINEVEARISEADERNVALEPWKEKDRAVREAKEASDKAAPMTAELAELDTKEKALLANAGIPVNGLSFGEDGEPLLNGRPLSVASGAEKIEMAVDVAVAANPNLKVCLVDEANNLDLEMLEALRKRALTTGFQIWLCRIGLEGKGQVEVVDGCATVPS